MVSLAETTLESQLRRFSPDYLGGLWIFVVQNSGSAATDQRNHNYVNEITQRTLTGGSPVVFQYDGATGASNGNLENDGTLIYSYDALNRPIQINRVSDGLVIATYLYDAMNRRVRKTISNGGLTGNIPNGTTDYSLQGWSRRAGISAGGMLADGWRQQVMEEERNPFGGSGSTDTPIRQYIWGTYPGAAALTRPLASTGFRQQGAGLGSLNVDECIELTTFAALGSQNLEPGSYYLLQDLLYRAVALTNSTGVIVEAYDTDAYGNTVIFTGPGADGVWFTDDDVQSSYGANEIIFQGRQYDPESQLYYFRTRYYVPALGRFVNRNPWVYIQGRYDLYDFAKDNPVKFSEPFSWIIVVGIGVGVEDLVTALGIGAAGATAVGVGLAGGAAVNNLRQSCPPPPNPKCAALAAQLSALAATAADDQRRINELNDQVWFHGGNKRLVAPFIGMLQGDYVNTLKEMKEVAAELAEC